MSNPLLLPILKNTKESLDITNKNENIDPFKNKNTIYKSSEKSKNYFCEGPTTTTYNRIIKIFPNPEERKINKFKHITIKSSSLIEKTNNEPKYYLPIMIKDNKEINEKYYQLFKLPELNTSKKKMKNRRAENNLQQNESKTEPNIFNLDKDFKNIELNINNNKILAYGGINKQTGINTNNKDIIQEQINEKKKIFKEQLLLRGKYQHIPRYKDKILPKRYKFDYSNFNLVNNSVNSNDNDNINAIIKATDILREKFPKFKISGYAQLYMNASLDTTVKDGKPSLKKNVSYYKI